MQKIRAHWFRLWPYLVVILGGVLLITGVFLPWYRVDFIDGEELTINALGWNSHPVKILPDLDLYGTTWLDALAILILGCLVVGLTLCDFWPKSRVFKWLLPLLSLFSVWQVFFGFDFDSHLGTINFWDDQEQHTLSLSVSSQPVIFVAWAGSLLALLGSIWLFFRKPKQHPINSDNNHRLI